MVTVAVNVTGAIAVTSALTVALPAADAVHCVLATPVPSVVDVSGLTVPPPETTVQSTATLPTPLSKRSTTRTASESASGSPGAVRCASPVTFLTVAAGPGSTVARNLIAGPEPSLSDPKRASTSAAAAVDVPSVHRACTTPA